MAYMSRITNPSLPAVLNAGSDNSSQISEFVSSEMPFNSVGVFSAKCGSSSRIPNPGDVTSLCKCSMEVVRRSLGLQELPPDSS